MSTPSFFLLSNVKIIFRLMFILWSVLISAPKFTPKNWFYQRFFMKSHFISILIKGLLYNRLSIYDTIWRFKRKSPSLRRKYSGEDFRKHFAKSVSIVASISYDTFVLYLHVFSEYVRRVPKRPKYSPTVTIWLQKDEPNKNCNQEYVQRLFRVLICCCYSNDYVELCSGIYGSSFHPFRR